MHPTFDLSNLDLLPHPFRTPAKVAIAASGSAEERAGFIMGLAILVCDKIPDMPQENLSLVLPVFPVTLDPALLRTVPNQLDSGIVPHDTRLRVFGMIFTVRATALLLARDAVPLAALGDLWTLIWSWMKLLEKRHDVVQAVQADIVQTFQLRSGGYLRSVITSVFGLLLKYDQMVRLMHVSPGVCAVVGRERHRLAKTSPHEADLYRVYQFLERWFTRVGWSPASFEELVLTSGGAREDLAVLVLKPVFTFLLAPDAAVNMRDQTVHTLGALFNFVGHTTGVFREHCDSAFRQALLSHGVIIALTEVSQLFITSGLPTADEEVIRVFYTLVDYQFSFPCHKWIAASISSGLLHIIYVCASRLIEGTRSPLYELLRLLSASSVHRSVLSQMERYLAIMEKAFVLDVIPDPDMVAHLQTFLAPVKDRLQILNEYKSGALIITMTCQNVRNVSNMRSNPVVDVQPHNTAREPAKLPTGVLGTVKCAKLSGGLAIIMLTRQEDIALEHLVFVRKYPDAAPYVLFDYTEDSCMISVRALDELEVEFPYDTARAKASDGRMELHVMRVLEGWSARNWLYLVHSPTDFIAGLSTIADTIPEGENLHSDGLEKYGAQVGSQTSLPGNRSQV
ncbi:hypothetical protein C8R45DRAFT_1176165 [Mycena sanguinolenta]|nr:hypothetical protein C8R45DRAFT_1176165 [Mycena sanguinolenta]